MFLDVIGVLLLVALLAFGAGALWKPLRALWGLIAGDQGLHWWTKKPYRPIFRGNGCSIPIKRGGRYQRIYLKRGRRSFKGYGRF